MDHAITSLIELRLLVKKIDHAMVNSIISNLDYFENFVLER
jgi:hypothetical protein